MRRIIAGRLDVQERAEKLAADIEKLGISPAKISVFYVNPDGRHHILRMGGDKKASPGASDAGKGAWIGGGVGAATGAAVGSVAGPPGAVAGAGVGAYTGSLAGAVSQTDKEPESGEEASEEPKVVDRKAGLHVAAEVDDKNRQDVVTLIRQHDAMEIEEAHGRIEDGHWVDFDPTQPVHLVS